MGQVAVEFSHYFVPILQPTYSAHDLFPIERYSMCVRAQEHGPTR